MLSILKAFTFCLLIGLGLSAANESKAYYVPGAWMSSYSSCYAYTYCPDGRYIYCRAQAHSSAYGTNSCRYRVLPGRAVHCQGYALEYNGWGGSFWRYVNIPVSCY